jgi:glycosyltransferase involved in cell wall biosynthesis
MRILMVSQFYAPVVGGQERAVENLSTALVRRGHDVALATLAQHGLPPFEVVGAVRVHRLHGLLQRSRALYREPQRRHAAPAPDPETVLELRRVLARERPDVIHTHDWLVHSMTPLRRRFRAPVVLTLHDHSLRCATKRLMRDDTVCPGPRLGACIACAARQYGTLKGTSTALGLRLSGPALRALVDCFLPVSESVAASADLRRAGLPYTVVNNFVPEHLFNGNDGAERSVEPSDGLPDRAFLLFAGDAFKDKGIEVLLEAHSRLPNRPPLVVIGRPYADSLRRPRPDVHVLGTRTHSAVLDALRRCAVAVVPSITPESFGFVALEAMVLGRPVVAARSGALPEIVSDGETGLLTPPGDATALATALSRLLDDPGLRERMGSAGRRRAEQFSESRVVQRVETIYQDLLERRRTTDSHRTAAAASAP